MLEKYVGNEKEGLFHYYLVRILGCGWIAFLGQLLFLTENPAVSCYNLGGSYYDFTTTQVILMPRYVILRHKVWQNQRKMHMPKTLIKPCKIGHILEFWDRRILWLEYFLSATALSDKRDCYEHLKRFEKKNGRFAPYVHLERTGLRSPVLFMSLNTKCCVKRNCFFAILKSKVFCGKFDSISRFVGIHVNL